MTVLFYNVYKFLIASNERLNVLVDDWDECQRELRRFLDQRSYRALQFSRGSFEARRRCVWLGRGWEEDLRGSGSDREDDYYYFDRSREPPRARRTRRRRTDAAARSAERVPEENASGGGSGSSGNHLPGIRNRSPDIDRACNRRWTLVDGLRSSSAGSRRAPKYPPLSLPESRWRLGVRVRVNATRSARPRAPRFCQNCETIEREIFNPL